MDIRKHFEYNPNLDITAAQIGINKWDWETIDSEDEDRAKEKMKAKRFDVLPILNPDGTVDKYFSTRIWNTYDKLNLNKIEEANSIYYRLSLNDLIRKFNTERRHYYFLTNYDEILGLVSFVNLDSQAVCNYLFQIIADIERSISCLLKEFIDQSEILEIFRKSDDRHLREVLADYDDCLRKGNDNSVFEHMYLQTVGITLSKVINKLPDNFKRLNKYSAKFAQNGVYTEVRNKVTHPVRHMLNDNETISKIDELLRDYLEIKDILRGI